MAEYHVIDTETSGLTHPIGVVEVAWLRINDQLEILDEHCVLVNPGVPIEPGAFAVHGISEEDVADAISLETALAPLAGEEVVLIAHNLRYDKQLVEKHLDVVGECCTLALSRQYVKGTENHKLATLVQHFGFPDLQAHRALGDATQCLNLLRVILHNTGLTLDRVVTRQQKPRLLLTMPFGKHRGMTMTQVPAEYRSWLLRQADLDKDVRYTLQQLKGI